MATVPPAGTRITPPAVIVCGAPEAVRVSIENEKPSPTPRQPESVGFRSSTVGTKEPDSVTATTRLPVISAVAGIETSSGGVHERPSALFEGARMISIS